MASLLHINPGAGDGLPIFVHDIHGESAHAQLADPFLGGRTPSIIDGLATVSIEAKARRRLHRETPIFQAQAGEFDGADAEAEADAEGRGASGPGDGLVGEGKFFPLAGEFDDGVESFSVGGGVQLMDEAGQAAIGGTGPETETNPLAGAGFGGEGERKLRAPGLSGDQGGGGGAEGAGEAPGAVGRSDGREVLRLRGRPSGTGGEVSLREGVRGEDGDQDERTHLDFILTEIGSGDE